MAQALVAFYSRADENYVNGQIKTLKTGNTQVAAGIIERFIEADVFKIQQLKSYSKSITNV